MTPAVDALRAAGVDFRLHHYDHDPSVESYGREAVDALGLDPASVFKTLVTSYDDASRGRSTLGLAVVPMTSKLDLKAYARAVGAKKAAMADPDEAQRATGYVVGGISPVGTKRRLTIVIDASAEGVAAMHCSAGRRGLEIELTLDDLVRITDASVATIATPSS